MVTRSRLTVILHADVAASTALVQKDEHVAHERIHAAFRALSGHIERFGGTVHELRGDALVAEFERASDAVSAALAFQSENQAAIARDADAMQPAVRIGVALGEVVVADQTVTGAGVVLAQRLEQLAVPGGVVIQGAVYEAMPQRMPFEVDSLGKRDLKGFAEPVRAFSVSLKANTQIPAPQPLRRRTQLAYRIRALSRRRSLRWLSAGMLICLLGALGWFQPWSVEFERAAVAEMRFELPDQPSVAVLPFENVSRETEDEGYADGIAENLVTALSQVPGIFVVSRYASFQYKGQQAPPRSIAEQLGVQYLLQGAFQRSGDSIRVSVQLIDSLAGSTVWAQSYDRTLSDYFAVQDDITLRVARAMRVTLIEGESARLVSSRTDNLKAWLLSEQSYDLAIDGRLDSYEKAVALAHQAIALDPDYAFALQGLGWLHLRFHPDRAEALRLSAELAAKAVQADPNYAGTYTLLANISLAKKDFDTAIGFAQKAANLAPNSPENLWYVSSVYRKAGLMEEAFATMQKAILRYRLAPPSFTTTQGMTYQLLGREAEALPLFRKAKELQPAGIRQRVLLVAGLASSGNLDEAQKEGAELLGLLPEFSSSTWALRRFRFYKDFDALSARYTKLLVSAGLPD